MAMENTVNEGNDSQTAFFPEYGSILDSAGIDYDVINDPNVDWDGLYQDLEAAVTEYDSEHSSAVTEYDSEHSSVNSPSDDSLTTVGEVWGADYNGNVIFYDEAETENARKVLDRFKEEFNSHLLEVKEADTFFDDIDYPYDQLVPTPRFEEIFPEISDGIDEAYSECITKINEVTDAIRNYSNGDEIDTNILDQWLNYGKTPQGNPGGNPSYDPGGNPSYDDYPSSEPDLELGDSEILDNTDSLDDSDTSILESDDNLEMSHNSSALSGSVLGTVLGNSTKISSELDDTDSSDDNLLSDFSTSLLEGGTGSKFFVPSLNSTVDSTAGVKSSGFIGAAGAVAAAAMAIGGKVYYDKKRDDENDGEENKSNGENEEVSDSIEGKDSNDVELEEIKTNNNKIDFGVNGVKFKELLFSDSEVDK